MHQTGLPNFKVKNSFKIQLFALLRRALRFARAIYVHNTVEYDRHKGYSH